MEVADAPSPTKATRVRPDQKGAEPQNVDRLGMADSVARKISGFDASYSDNTPRLQSLIRNTDAVSQGASANSIAHLLKPSGNPAKSTKHVVDRLKPRHRDRDLGAQSAQPDGRSPPLASPTKAASRSATAATTPTSSKYFSSSKSRVQAAEEYDEALVVVSPKRSARSTRRTTLATPVDLRSPSPPPRSVTAPNSDTKRPYKRRSSITPRPPASTLPNKSIELRGIQIGKYVQLAKLDVRLAPSAMLKLNVHPLQRNMEITGLHDGYEFMKIDINDIDTLEYMSVDKVAVMCITPKNTVESVFEEAMFDPSSSSADLKLMYLCWELQNKSIADIIPRFAAAFEQVFSSGELDLEIYEKYAQELSQPGSVDLISSSDDENRINSKGRNAQKGLADSSMDEAVLSSGVVKKQYTAKPQPPKADTSKSGKPGAFSYWSSIDNLPSTTTKPREDPWGVRNISGRQQALGTSLGGSATCAGQKRYSLRNATNVSIAEPPSESDDDDDFVSQKRVFGFTDHTIRFEYPPGDRKSITVTGSDISRLYRSEFLNDTVIEFYLRYISENLRARDPKLYEQCFFFNTFFFKKLSQRHKGAAAGSNDEIIEAVYSQLKKWTANADLFSKKYIFVPINENIHWYLAIITNPDLLLSKNSESSDHKDSASAAAPDGDGNGNGNGDGMTAADVDAKDSQESRHTLSDYFAVKSADTLSNGKPDDEPTQPTCQATKDIDGDIEMPDASEIICPAKDDCALAAKAAPQTTSLPVYKRSSSLDSAKQHSPEVVIDLSAPAHPKTVTLIFRGKEVQVPETKYQDPTSSPSIVILDSLGNKHPSTFGLLRGYIQSEAKHKHKRHVEHSPLGKYAKVPLQNNLCDCGVFVLHYVEEFLSDPLTFMTMALNGVSMREWFVPGLVKQKRKDILSLATRLAEEHTASLKESKKSADLSPSADSLSAKAEDQQTLEPTKDSSKSDDANMAEAARVGSEPENKS
ncbi:hypothetical protein GGI12_003501 [Dipsacomyces acuminosporus]|nr:hypothetical protein GGI12_003501 [Dipsacomyces acuminosporus]